MCLTEVNTEGKSPAGAGAGWATWKGAIQYIQRSRNTSMQPENN